MSKKHNLKMAPKKGNANRTIVNKGAWTTDEDRRLSNYIQQHGANQWRTVSLNADFSGLNRSAKSCRLRWLNYLRPNIRRGNISAEEEDLILRLHKLLGNRWSLIAGRLPGRTDNEIKNYWNSHLSKKATQEVNLIEFSAPPTATTLPIASSEEITEETVKSVTIEDYEITFDMNDLFDFSFNTPMWLGSS